MESADFEEALFFVSSVNVDSFTDGVGAEDDSLLGGGTCGHLGDKSKVMFTWFVCDIDGAAGDAAAGGVEGGVFVRGLKHIPIRKDIEVAGEEGVVGVGEDVEGVAGGDVGEKVVAIADHEARLA